MERIIVSLGVLTFALMTLITRCSSFSSYDIENSMSPWEPETVENQHVVVCGTLIFFRLFNTVKEERILLFYVKVYMYNNRSIK